jgi:hypothetical protein
MADDMIDRQVNAGRQLRADIDVLGMTSLC